jgi:excisionase family DNA binding protein
MTDRKAATMERTTEVRAEWMNYPDAERHCGLSRQTIWRHVSAGEIDATHVGRAVRISRASVKSFMRSKVKA